MNKAVVYIGIDVAKASLDVAWAKRSRRFANNKSGLSALTKWVKQSPFAVHLICEASGGYERGLLDAAEQNAIKLSLVQANRVRQYARAPGILAKTDEVDARVLCAFGSAMQPKPRAPLSAQQKQLREWETQRRHLSRLLVAEQNRLAQLNAKELQRLTRCLLASLKKQMALIDARLAALIAQDQTLREKAQKLTAIAGVGRRTAVLLLAQMPELGTLNRAQTAALAGLAPFNRDSGTLRGKRTIFGGRRALRCGLYMAALVAARHNRVLRDFYQRLRTKGKPHKVALTAVMRKLILALNQALKPTPCFA
jgi:transposase